MMNKAVCGCGVDHATIKASEELFAACELIGFQVVEADDYGPAERIEVRNCVHGGTMYRELWRSDASTLTEAEVDGLIEVAKVCAGLPR